MFLLSNLENVTRDSLKGNKEHAMPPVCCFYNTITDGEDPSPKDKNMHHYKVDSRLVIFMCFFTTCGA